jgi:N-acyl-D-aspartate/D-glutamate deacylase
VAYDIAIRNGMLVDGSGGAPVRADVAVQGDRIAAVGQVTGEAHRTIDAEGCLVTPGFVDIHTHLDAQVFWDPAISSPCWHGVTSVVMGNCGVGFAPCKAEDREFLARLMESVEDIPTASIMEGLSWNWETFGEYLDEVERLPKGMNVGGMVGHCAVRYQAMGKRCLDEKPASPEDIERMAALVDEAISAGALGFSTSRTRIHKTPDGIPIPGTFAETDELMAFGRVMGKRGKGVFEAVPYLESEDPQVHMDELEWMRDLCLETGRPLTFGLIQTHQLPDVWKTVLQKVEEAGRAGARLFPQTQVRSVGVLFGLVNLTPFDMAGGTWGLLKMSSFEERLEALRKPDVREKLIADAAKSPFPPEMMSLFYRLPVVNGEARYDLDPSTSLAAIAERRGVSPAEAFIDEALETDGRAFYLFPFANQDFSAVAEMLTHPQVLLGLADSGAHCGQIQDASLPTYLLSYWVRERGLFPVEEAIRKLTSEPAELFGLRDRGAVREGAFADLNVIDFDALRVLEPEYIQDFPAGAWRYIQRGEGYRHTLVNGRTFMENGQHTGEHSGALLRS